MVKLWIRIARIMAVWFVTTLAIFYFGRTVPGFQISDIPTAAVAAILLGLVNGVLWPVIFRLKTQALIIIAGFVGLLVNGYALATMGIFIPGIHIGGMALIIVPVGLLAVDTILAAALTIDDDVAYYRAVIKNSKSKVKSDYGGKPGYIFLELDGLSESTLRKAILCGAMPTLGGWLSTGTHKLRGWETDLSSQTGASQAGILHGNNKDIPAFRWLEKANGNKVVTANGIGSTPTIESRISNGNGLLAMNGDSVVNLFSGDAKDKLFVYSDFGKAGEVYGELWNAFAALPYNFLHVGFLALWDMGREMRSQFRQWHDKIEPRLRKHEMSYFIVRASSNVFLREVVTYRVIKDIIAGEKDAVYATFFGYDEIAHHSGADDKESIWALSVLDRCIGRINRSRIAAKRPYIICVLSDHGQTNGATFRQRYGIGLDCLVESLMPKGVRLYRDLDSNQDHFSEIMNASEESEGRVVGKPKGKKPVTNAEAYVLASGNMGLIYFTCCTERLTIEQINGYYPRMIQGLTQHEGIGFVMVRSKEKGCMVIGAKGTHYLDTGAVDGEDPLAKYGKRAVEHLHRNDSFNYVPDILVMSMYDPEKDEVASFEELVGCHGGLGGDQSRPFVIHPAGWDLGEGDIVGAERLYCIFKEKMDLGQPASPKKPE